MVRLSYLPPYAFDICPSCGMSLVSTTDPWIHWAHCSHPLTMILYLFPTNTDALAHGTNQRFPKSCHGRSESLVHISGPGSK